ncbi:MAG: family 20 glycosylhydrolase [Acidobacteria bacterium]|nr:family 20 glycosylhydrolase [Acidobacteriota bacterium]
MRNPGQPDRLELGTLKFNYNYRYSRRPEVAEPSGLTRDDVRQLLEACRAAGVRLVPQLNLLGHQSWSKNTAALLRAHPEFDETPGAYPNNEGIYCRSYCPLHPQVHEVVFDLMDELTEACEANALHVGMDEVFLLGEDQCPRCRGKSKAELFALELRTLHAHLAASNRALWMWADRFLDGETTGIGKWEASLNHTAPALALVPNDIVMCDWHYEAAHPTAPWFAVQGFPVLSCPWRRASVALRQLDQVRAVRLSAHPKVADRMLGMLQTTWCGFARFARGYFRENTTETNVMEAVNCFRELFRELRREP